MARLVGKGGVAPTKERRTGDDRRKRDLARPAGERRRAVEPRKPEVTELDLSPAEWAALHAEPPPPPEELPAKKHRP